MTAHRIDRRAAMTLLVGGCSAILLPGRIALAAHPAGFDDGLPRATPADQGMATDAMLAFLTEVVDRGFEFHSFMLARHGAVLAEGYWWPYRAELPHMTHSLTKSVTATAIGMALAEGRFALTDKVVSFFEAELPPVVSENLAAMTIEDLLTMRTGHAGETSGSVWRPIRTSWVAEFFKIPVVHRPGTTFVYTSAATYMLSALISKTTGRNTYDYLKPRFFQPLGISGEEWAAGPQDITPGANGLSWKVADSLKLGILHQQEGRHAGRQIVPADWVRAVHQPHVPGRYGYQWWLGPNRYQAIGLFGQYSYVFPDSGVVLALMSAMTRPRRTEWEEVLDRHMPMMVAGSGSGSSALPRLRALTDSLRVNAPLAAATSPTAARISGKTYAIAPNVDAVDAIRIDIADGKGRLTLRDDRNEHRVDFGLGGWIEGSTSLTGHKLHHEYQPNSMRVVAGGGWSDPATLEIILQFTETAFQDRLRLRFDGDSLAYDRSVNVNSGDLARPTLTGRLKA